MYQFVDMLFGMIKQTNQIGGGTRCEPVILYTQMPETFQDAEWIEDVGHPFSEVVTIISVFQYLDGLIFVQIQFDRQLTNGFREDRQ